MSATHVHQRCCDYFGVDLPRQHRTRDNDTRDKTDKKQREPMSQIMNQVESLPVRDPEERACQEDARGSTAAEH
jgi:hypothetical protein